MQCILVIGTILISTVVYAADFPYITIQAGTLSEKVPCALYANGEEVDLCIIPHKTKPHYDRHLLVCALSLLNTLHESQIDFRPLERFSFKPTIHNETHWASLRNDHTIELPAEVVHEFEWPQQLRQDTHMQIRSYLDLVKYPEIARDYIDIAHNLFINDPVIYMQDIEAAMTKTSQNVPVTKKRRKTSDDNPAPRKIQKIHAPLVITDTIWEEIDTVFPYEAFKCITLNVRNAMEAICWNLRSEKSWQDIPSQYGVKGKAVNRLWCRMRQRCDAEELKPLILLLEEANNDYEQAHVELVDTISSKELVKPIITNQIWKQLKEELPYTSRTSKLTNREFLETMCWKMTNNCSWRSLPHGFNITGSALHNRWARLKEKSNWTSIERILLQAIEDAKNIKNAEIVL